VAKEIKERSEALSEAVEITENLAHNEENKYGRFHEPTFSLRSSRGYGEDPPHWVLNFKFTGWSFNEKDQMNNLLEYLESLDQPTELYISHDKPLCFSVYFKKEGDES